MIDAIRASFKKGLPNLDWMDDKTRRAAEDKVMLIYLNLANVTLGMSISLLIHVTPMSVGSLSNYDDDHNDNFKKNRFNVQNNSSARASRF